MTLKKNQHFRAYAFGEGGGGHQKAYALYAFINVDNCERPLRKRAIRLICNGDRLAHMFKEWSTLKLSEFVKYKAAVVMIN